MMLQRGAYQAICGEGLVTFLLHHVDLGGILLCISSMQPAPYSLCRFNTTRTALYPVHSDESVDHS